LTQNMKNIKSLILLFTLIMGSAISCKDDDIQLLPEWETGVHGNAVLQEGSSNTFILDDEAVDLTVDLAWISIGNQLEVEKIEVFVLWNETYTDTDGNPAVAAHGGDEGRLFATFEGDAVPENRSAVTFTVSQANLYTLYEDAAYDYDGDGAAPTISAFSNPDKPERDADTRFVPGDAFSIRWEFTTTDGRVFNKWGVSVCTEFPDANCSIDFAVICSPVIASPPGDYTINMLDSYGDGWNGAAIRVIANGTPTDYTIDDGSAGSVVVTIPPGTTTLTFEFVSGDYDSEVTFTIVSPKGNIIAKKGPSPAEGEITLDLCKE
jgi:hypothetical protein